MSAQDKTGVFSKQQTLQGSQVAQLQQKIVVWRKNTPFGLQARQTCLSCKALTLTGIACSEGLAKQHQAWKDWST